MKIEADAPVAGEQGAVRWNTAGLRVSYCNVANAIATRDAVTLNFGLNQSGDRARAEQSIELLHRIVLSPLAAKNLHQLLGKLIGEYDANRR
jgi:hypothetical protein